MGFLPALSAAIIDPTPAWVITTLASRMCESKSVNGMKSTQVARGARARGPALDHQALLDRECFDAAEQPIELLFARADSDEDHRMEKTLPT